MIFVLTVLAVIVVIVLSFAVSIFNGLISLKNQIDRSWANIEVILKQRFDEIPQLIQIVEQYAGYEQATLKKIAAARNSYAMARTTEQKVSAANNIIYALSGLIALSEAFPELNANAGFLHLQGRISDLEELLADRRQHFNDTVTNFNTRIEQIPDFFFSRILGYRTHMLYRSGKS